MTAESTATYGVNGMEKPKDYYSLLGVARNASPSTIRRAFRKLSRRYPPDARAGSEAEALHALRTAYETLTDAERRRRYDASLAHQDADRRPAPAWSFLRGPARSELRRPMAPATVTGDILLSPEEARSGGPMSLDVPVEGSCPACEGTGGVAFDCGECGGEGKLARRVPLTVHLPRGVRDGTVFHVRLDEPALVSVLLTVHVRQD